MTDQLWASPTTILTRAGLTPDPWQRQLLDSTADRLLLLCTRQAGKSTAAAALALWTACTQPGSLILLLSPTLRQSGELFRDKVMRQYKAWVKDFPQSRETQLTLELANGSRIISLPENEAGVRGFSSVALLIIDEASRVDDGLYYSVRPMLAVSHGRLVALSTPFGKRGWFFTEWEGGSNWERVRITAHQCPRITADFLAEERRALGDRWYKQEYECDFSEAIDAVFAYHDIEAALDMTAVPLFGVFDPPLITFGQ